uniref:Amine oxidase domain-containing protein n=1 Tax=Chromera velia CCMP2878 TaxID=1169474 RepID=A0A0G4I0H7_9ALVE|mmetsp:Transcript_32201/g.63884  ORF Transcript_32201/g.63884 Transcript_32201/m.63884 type:complete len:604 (+) Transcript_32201:144-1955(+)|eukprot:Cvel_9956.t1-p1 / transcript=Cvel_9956.t1 / gene=Cvel_9956 / organism=Chromera_velia_CCMP2878 / gene_product=Prolycopene isomerase, chloroplastic, putative / transcript_product=Prolycopene isomerase, chloroplastic, putative / location=Cvel_scaffold589:57485-60812(+) / protein_length=603 / sequence_SO=supercontig / SO=protein_coding / is_pseudo=false
MRLFFALHAALLQGFLCQLSAAFLSRGPSFDGGRGRRAAAAWRRATSSIEGHSTALKSNRLSTVELTKYTPQKGVPEDYKEVDVVVIGSGIGGLVCAAMAARYGQKVLVVESHTEIGGAAHSWEKDGYVFDSGPSLFSGLSSSSPNPLRWVFEAIEEEPEWILYDTWGVSLPEGKFNATVGPEPFLEIVDRFGGPGAKEEWLEFMKFMEPLSDAAMAVNSLYVRIDSWILVSLLFQLYESYISIKFADSLTRPFSEIAKEGGIKDRFLSNWLNMLAFLLQGLPADGTKGAVMAYMLADWYRPGVTLEYPKGGTQAIAEALVRGIKKYGGEVIVNAHVDKIRGKERAEGVVLRGGNRVTARKAVVSNASLWDTLQMLPRGSTNADVLVGISNLQDTAQKTERCDSFMHLHAGFDGTGLSGLQCHYAVVQDWDKPIDSPGNVIIISIPSVLDPSLAPSPGKHVLHAYTAGSEPWSIWKDLSKQEYEKKRQERGEILLKAVEKFIPDFRKRSEVSMIGTPKTHARYLRRFEGTYGPKDVADGSDNVKLPSTEIPGLWLAGDSTFPGIGVPAVATSGAMVANSLTDVISHVKLVKSVEKKRKEAANK